MNNIKQLKPLISVAPMMDWTDRHDRYFLRLIAPDIWLYTEMVTAQAILHGDRHYLLDFDAKEHPIALQLGGSDPVLLAKSTKIAEEFGYDEINLNVGCPSDRVKAGHFGACLMLTPHLVAECFSAMQQATTRPVTIKCRIGVDHEDSYEYLYHFIRLIAEAGCKTFIIHARKAWLSGLSPKQNREIPPLRYEVVRKIKSDFPHLKIILNGGIKTLADIEAELPYVDGIMIGRAAYSNPYLLAEIQANYFNNKEILSREQVALALIPYIRHQLKNKVKLTAITRHIHGLFQGKRGAAAWRRYLSENAHQPAMTEEIIDQALTFITEKTG